MPQEGSLGETYISKTLRSNMRSWFRLALEQDNIRRIHKSLTAFVGRGKLHFYDEISEHLKELSEELGFRFPPRNIYDIIGHVYAAERVLQRLKALRRTHNHKTLKKNFEKYGGEEVLYYRRAHPNQ